MVEAVITVVIVLGAAVWLVRWLRASASGKRGCGCGKCAKGCAVKSASCLRSGEEKDS